VWGLWSEDTPENVFDVPGVGEKIWLECSFDSDCKLTGIAVRSGPVGEEEWSNFPDPIEINTDGASYQEFYRQVIAEITDPSSDTREGSVIATADGTPVKLVQLLKSHLLLVPAVTTADADYPGLKIQVAIPSNAPWTASDGSGNAIVEQSATKTPWEFGSQVEEDFPFKVMIKSDPAEPGGYLIGVSGQSLLFNSNSYEDRVEIEGLLTDDSGWISWNSSYDLVWLEIEWDDWPSSYNASIKSFSTGDEWENGEIETDGEDPPTQTKARIVLGIISVGDAGNPVLEQRVRTHLQLVSSFEYDSESGKTLECLIPAVMIAPDAIPDWLEGSGNADSGWDVCMGSGWSSFCVGRADPLRAFELEVSDPQDDSASSLSLVVGDDYGEASDMFQLTSGSEDAQNKVLFQWVDYPLLELSNDAGSGLTLSVEDTNPKLLLADDWDDPDYGNQIDLNLESGPEIFLKDDVGNELTINSIDTPIVELNDTEDHSGNQISLNLKDGPELFLCDGYGSEISMNITDDAQLLMQDDSGNSMEVKIDDITREKDGETSKALFASDGTSEGDVLYWDGEKWEVATLEAGDGDMLVFFEGGWTKLERGENGSLLVIGDDQPYWMSPGADGDVLRCNADGPYWDSPVECGGGS
jgi:hypothetical protein